VSLLTHLLSVVVATNSPAAAVSNEIQQTTGISVTVPDANDPVEQELQKLMADDDAAQAEVDKWIRDNNDFYTQGAGEPKDELNQRILERFAPVHKGYEDFLRRHPGSAHGYLAYGSFLNDIGDEDGAAAQYEKSRQLDPKNPAVWNNLANYYGEHSPVTNAFVYYARAMELSTNEPVYYQNLATTVYLFRRDAMKFYGITEPQVFDKALALYQKAVMLDPENFPLATDYAQSYYGVKPLRTNDALMAWTNALQIARDEVEREGVYIHFARIKMSIGRFDEARAHLDAVTNGAYGDMKKRLERNLDQREHPSTNTVEISTNAVAGSTNAAASISETAPTLTNDKVAATKPMDNSTTNAPVSVAAPDVSTNAAEMPANVPSLPANDSVAPTNAMIFPTNPPPVLSAKSADGLTNIPPAPPNATNLLLNVSPPELRPIPPAASP
jgi:tetratricopeptide (TPR) repeat protein